MNEKKRRKVRLPAVCPAGQRCDRKLPGNVPCPDHGSLEEEHRWQEEHIQ